MTLTLIRNWLFYGVLEFNGTSANEWLEGIIKEDPENENWFRVQFKKLFPEFKEWIRNKEAEKESRKVA